MNDIVTTLQHGNGWLFVPSAILLGALHGLEPGHSKTMMAAFIIAIRGTVTQAALLGLSATVSHTAVVWLVAMTGLYFGQGWTAETSEPYFQLASAVMIVGVAAWMFWRTQQSWSAGEGHVGAHHHHDHDHDLEHEQGHGHDHGHAHSQAHDHEHDHRFEREPDDAESAGSGHDDGALRPAALDLGETGFQDPHELAHAQDIHQRFANREVTTGQIIVFGLTGGLVPCPASITVLLLCLQLKKIALGASLVLCFSIGLAITMVASGTLAALSVRHASRRWRGFGEFARKAPYFSSALILVVGVVVGWQGLSALMARPG